MENVLFHHYLAVALESLFVSVVGYAQIAGMVGTRVETIVEGLKSKRCGTFHRAAIGKKVRGGVLEMTPNQLFQAAGGACLRGNRQSGMILIGILITLTRFPKKTWPMSSGTARRRTRAPRGLRAP